MELPIDLIDNVFEYLYFREILSFINSCKSHISNFSTILWVRYKNYHGLEFLITNAMSWRNIREQCYLKSFKYVYSNILCICSRYIEDIVKLESQNCRLSKEIIKLKPNHINFKTSYITNKNQLNSNCREINELKKKLCVNVQKNIDKFEIDKYTKYDVFNRPFYTIKLGL